MEPAVDSSGDVQEERPQLDPAAGDRDAAVSGDRADHGLVVQHQGGAAAGGPGQQYNHLPNLNLNLTTFA